MNPHFFQFCYLSFPILILTLLPTPSTSDKEQYTSCSQSFQCSNIPNLTYPFWGGNRPAYCGHPNFELTCQQNQPPQLTINSIPYRVLSIDNPTRTLTVARAEFWNNPCPNPSRLHVNATLDKTQFAYSTDSQDMIIYYNCPALIPGVTLPVVPEQFSCANDNGATTVNYFGIPSGGGEVNDLVTVVSGCTGSVVVRVNQTVAMGLVSAAPRPPSVTIKEVLDSGFGLQWDADDATCSECVRSGGVCGSGSGSGTSFACYCSDQAYSFACNSTRGGSGTCSTSNCV